MTGIDGATLEAKGQAVIHNNHWGGMHGRLGVTMVIGGGVTISGNGNSTDVNFLFPRFRSGVSVYAGSLLTVFANNSERPSIMGNFGPGIILDLGSIGRLLGMSVESNAAGFVALNNSTAEFLPEFGFSNTLTGNRGLSRVLDLETKDGDLVCDNTSVVVGDFSEVGINNCASTGGGGSGK